MQIVHLYKICQTIKIYLFVYLFFTQINFGCNLTIFAFPHDICKDFEAKKGGLVSPPSFCPGIIDLEEQKNK